ncbi:MAG: pyrroline-5-carboxylate reductase [Legionella sp.]|uniref:pyrroline-5-carboxylate reductase n=1 Tax=Legionella sp. TaxID=459 RepID=UPI00284920BF|nr:pyrroline-5-carboxylate reductase [Legionella sp.]
MNNKQSISLIGAGHLGRALLCGLIKSGYPAQSITVSNRNQDKLNRLVHELAVLPATSNNDAVDGAEILILAVKPQFMQDVCQEIAAKVQMKKPLIISLAGVTEIEQIAQWLGVTDLSIIRVMTNTPMEFCKGTSALFANSCATDAHKKITETLFNTVGSAFWVDKEQLLDPLTAAIGSAPAYVFLFMEALQKAAASQNIPEALAEKIAIDVVSGAAVLAKQSNYSFAELRAGVTTPHGITEHSLKALDTENFFTSFKKIYQAANERIEQIKSK